MTKNKTITSKGSTILTTDSLDFLKGSDYTVNYRADGIYFVSSDKTYALDMNKFIDAGITDGSIVEVIDIDDLMFKINGTVAGHETSETVETLIEKFWPEVC